MICENIKSEIRMDILKPYFTDTNVKPTIQGKKLQRYRNNIIFTIGYNIENKIEIGPLSSDGLVEPAISNLLCSLLSIDVCECMKNYIVYLSQLPICDKLNKTGFWRHIQIRENTTRDYLITFRVCNINEYQEIFESEKDMLVSYLQKNVCYKLLQINYQIIVGKREPTINDKIFSLYFQGELYQSMLGINFIISPLCFFQVNYETAELMFEKVRSLVRENDSSTLIDLCCGIGVYSNICRDCFINILGIDCNKYNIITGNKLKSINDRSNHINYICGKVEDKIAYIFEREDNTLIINPGRSGLPQKVSELISDNIHKFKQIIYISCNPKTLLRDLNIWQINKTNIDSIIHLNLFPLTQHIEVIVNLIL